MDKVAILIGISWTGIGLLTLGLSFPLTRGMIGRNRVYGIRFAESFASDEAWFTINRFGGKRLRVWALPLIAVGIISFFLPLQSHSTFTLILGFVPLVFIAFPAIETWRFARNPSRRNIKNIIEVDGSK